MIITAKSGKNDKIHVSVDNEYAFTVDAFFWYSCGVCTGDEINDSELEALKNAVGHRRAYNKALDLLSRRDYGQKELVKRLCQAFDSDDAETAVQKAVDLGLVNDETYAKKLMLELSERKLMSPAGIRSELIFRGISREIADNTVEGLDIEQKERIIKILMSKFARRLSTEKEKKRAFAWLVRSGYSYSDIRCAMKEVEGETTDFE